MTMKFLRRSKKKQPPLSVVVDHSAVPDEELLVHKVSSKGRSIGGGFFDGPSIFWNYTIASSSDNKKVGSITKKVFLRQASSFLRVADLCLGGGPDCWSRALHQSQPQDSPSVASSITDDLNDAASCFGETESVANFCYAAADPPPGMEHDPNEKWVALDDGEGAHTPIAPFAISALAKVGYESVMNEEMWSPQAPKQLKACPWHAHTWEVDGQSSAPLGPYNKKEDDQIVLWTGKFHHGLYGSDLPAVRAAGILPVNPRVLFDLLVDSSRVQEYNKLSLGRDDLLVLQNDMDNDGPFGKSITKVMRSRSQPPILSKTMEFVSILHAKELNDGSGYMLVTRAVTHPDSSLSSSGVLHSEILMGVNVLRKVQGDPNRCLLVTVNHIRSPMVPMMIAKRIGGAAAAGYICDLRAATANMQ